MTSNSNINGVNSIAFSVGYNKILAIGNEDSTTKLCEIQNFGPKITLNLLATVKKNNNPVIHVALQIFNDNYFLATCDSNSTTIWKISRSNMLVDEIKTLEIKGVTSIVFHPIANPPILAISSYTNSEVLLFQTNDAYNNTTQLKSINSSCIIGVNSIAFNNDGTLLAIGNRDNRVTLYGIGISENLKELNYFFIQILLPNYNHMYNTPFINKNIDQSPIMSVAFDYSGRFLAAGSQDKTIKIWSIEKDNIYLMTILKGHGEMVTSVAFFPKEYIDLKNNLKINYLVIATSSLDKTTRIWVVKNNSREHQIDWTSDCVETIENTNIVKSIAYKTIADARVGMAYFLNSLNIIIQDFHELTMKFKNHKNQSNSSFRRFIFKDNPNNHSGGGLQNESRFFKLVSVNGKEVDGGRYELPSKTKFGKEQTRGPKDKASIAFSEICKKNNKKGECTYKFAIQETTRGSNKKVYHYEGKRVKLTKPIVLELNDKKVVIKYKNVITPIH